MGIDISDIFKSTTPGRKFSKEHRNKISKAKLGKPHSREHCDNISKSLTGKTFTEEHRTKISVALMGNSNAAKHKEKFSKDLLKLYCDNEDCVRWIEEHKEDLDKTLGVKTEVQLGQDNIKESSMYDDGILPSEVYFFDAEEFMVKALDGMRLLEGKIFLTFD